MRFTAQQHERMAASLHEKAKVEGAPKKKHRLEGLALAHRLLAQRRAKQEKASRGGSEGPFSEDTYQQALPYLEAGIAHFASDGADLPAVVQALVDHLAKAGMDADAIRNMKPYIRRFTEQRFPARSRSMHQAAARYWNEIAETQPLKTEWAQQMFPLPQEDMDLALENEEKRLMRETSNPVLAAAYLKIMPLLWENAAISDYLKENPSLKAAIPPIENIAEAIMMARKDFRLTTPELTKLKEMLEKPPTPNGALSAANSIINDYNPSARKRLRYRDRDELPRIAKVLFCPSFDAETLLRIIAGSDGTTVELTSAESFFARRFTYKSIVAPNCALRFWANLDAMLATPFNIERNLGLDGTTIKVDCRTPAGSANFEVWSPESTTHAGRLVGLIYDFAWEFSTAASAVNCLERLRGYSP
jgi:hypothetical protein